MAQHRKRWKKKQFLLRNHRRRDRRGEGKSENQWRLFIFYFHRECETWEMKSDSRKRQNEKRFSSRSRATFEQNFLCRFGCALSYSWIEFSVFGGKTDNVEKKNFVILLVLTSLCHNRWAHSDDIISIHIFSRLSSHVCLLFGSL